MKTCGFHTIKDQLKLKRLLVLVKDGSDVKQSQGAHGHGGSAKLTLHQMKETTADNKRLYLTK